MPKREKEDPTKDPEFQKVVRHFLSTPPKPHKPAPSRPKPASRKPSETV